MWIRAGDDIVVKLRNEHVLVKGRSTIFFASTSQDVATVVIPCKNEEAAKEAFDILISRLEKVGLLVDLRPFIAEESTQEVSTNDRKEGCTA